MDGVIKRSLVSKDFVEMIYVDGKGDLTQRKIRVLEIRENQIIAYCYSRKEVRSFKKDGILSAFPHYQRKGVVNG